MVSHKKQEALQLDEFADEGHQLEERFQNPNWGARKLQKISLFENFTEGELAELYRMGRLVKLKPNAHAVIEGDTTRGMYLLLHGLVSVYKKDPSTGSLMRLAILEPGAHFGEMSLFDQAPRSATVAAESPCHLFQLDEPDFNRFLEKAGPDLQVRFFKTCAENLAARFRVLNSDYLTAQQLLWRYALRRHDDEASSS